MRVPAVEEGDGATSGPRARVFAAGRDAGRVEGGSDKSPARKTGRGRKSNAGGSAAKGRPGAAARGIRAAVRKPARPPWLGRLVPRGSTRPYGAPVTPGVRDAGRRKRLAEDKSPARKTGRGRKSGGGGSAAKRRPGAAARGTRAAVQEVARPPGLGQCVPKGFNAFPGTRRGQPGSFQGRGA